MIERSFVMMKPDAVSRRLMEQKNIMENTLKNHFSTV